MPDADDATLRYQPTSPGTITKMKVQRKNPERMSVFLDGAFAFGVYQDVVLEFGLQVGRRLSVEEQEQILAADQLRVAKAMALHYLAHRDRTVQEVRRRLQRRGFDEAVITDTVERLQELGYLDDAAYARTYVQGRFRNRGYGPVRIRSELLRRGVARDLAEEAVQALVEEEDLLEEARRHARKRWPRLAREPDPYKRRQKLSNYLLRRGFSYDTVRRVVDELEASGD